MVLEIGLWASMHLTSFFLSFYLNTAASSKQRATVLRFKGLFLKAGYGIIGLLYGGLLAYLRYSGSAESSPSAALLKNVIIIESLPWFVGYFCLVCVVLMLTFGRTLAVEHPHRPNM